MKTESKYSFVVKAENSESEEFCSHEYLQDFVERRIGKFSLREYSSNPDLYFGSDLENIEQAA